MQYSDISFDDQLRAARKRTEDFSRSVSEARQQETEALQLLEQERRAWTASFAEKNVMIEQLERELACTVDALARNPQGEEEMGTIRRSVDNFSRNDAERVTQPPARGEAFGREAGSPRKPVVQGEYPVTAAMTDPFRLQKHPVEAEAYFSAPVEHTSDPYRARVPASPAGTTPHHASLRESALREENERLSGLVQDLDSAIEKVKNAWRESDTKLSFRTSQVRELEETIEELQANNFRFGDHIRGSDEKLRQLTSDYALLEESNKELRRRVLELEDLASISQGSRKNDDSFRELELKQMQEKLQVAESNVTALFSRLRVVELERERDKEDNARRENTHWDVLESARQKDKQKEEAILRRSLDAQELMKMQMNQHMILHKSKNIDIDTTGINNSPTKPNRSSSPLSPSRTVLSRDAQASVSPGRYSGPEASSSPLRGSAVAKSRGSGSRPSSFDSLRGEDSPKGRDASYYRRSDDGGISPLMGSPAVSQTRLSHETLTRPQANAQAWNPPDTVTGSALNMSSSGGDDDADAWLEDNGDDSVLIASLTRPEQEVVEIMADDKRADSPVLQPKPRKTKGTSGKATNGKKSKTLKTKDQTSLKAAKNNAVASPSVRVQRYATPTTVSSTRCFTTSSGKVGTKPRTIPPRSGTARTPLNKGGDRTETKPLAPNSTSVKPIYIDMRPVSHQNKGDTSLLSLASDTPAGRPRPRQKKESAVPKSVVQRPEFSISTAKVKPALPRTPSGLVQANKTQNLTPRRATSSISASSRGRVRPESDPRVIRRVKM